MSNCYRKAAMLRKRKKVLKTRNLQFLNFWSSLWGSPDPHEMPRFQLTLGATVGVTGFQNRALHGGPGTPTDPSKKSKKRGICEKGTFWPFWHL